MLDLNEYKSQIQEDSNSLSLDQLVSKYQKNNKELDNIFQEIRTATVEQKKELGQLANSIKNIVNEAIELKKSSTDELDTRAPIDPTAPFDINTKLEDRPLYLNRKGSKHPLMQELENILDIFTAMGFDIVESRQLDNDYNMFEALNIPKGHPARDIWDTFWTDDNLIPPAHTSTMQNRVMKEYKNPPIRVVIPGRVYRNEATDASHEHTFYQVEGIYIDKGITMAHMLATIKKYLEEFFQLELEIKIQPAYFPFTEPDAEYLISCPFCKKTGCSVCGYNGWIEIMGCGMIHPSVLREGGIDPDVYSGFAWGFGLDRMVLLKNGIQDIRRFHSADINFLKQF